MVHPTQPLPVLRASPNSNVRNCRFSSALLYRNQSKPLRFLHRFDRLSSVFKRKNRRFLSVSKHKKRRLSSIPNVRKIDFWHKLADWYRVWNISSQIEKPTSEIYRYDMFFYPPPFSIGAFNEHVWKTSLSIIMVYYFLDWSDHGWY